MPFSIHPAFFNLVSTTFPGQSLVCREPRQAPETFTCLPGVEDSALALSYVQALRSARTPLHLLNTLPEQSRDEGPVDGADAGASLEASFQEYFHMDWVRGTWDQRVMGGLLFIPALAAVTIAGIGSIQGCSRRENPQSRAPSPQVSNTPATTSPAATPNSQQARPYGPFASPEENTNPAFPRGVRAREGDSHYPSLHWIQTSHPPSDEGMSNCDDYYKELATRDTLRVQISIRNFLRQRGARLIFLENYTELGFSSLRDTMLNSANAVLLGRLRVLSPRADSNHFFAPYQEDGDLLGFYSTYGGVAAYHLEHPSSVRVIPIEDPGIRDRVNDLLQRLGSAAWRNPEFMGLMRDREIRAFHLMNGYSPASSSISTPDYYWVMGAAHTLVGGSARYSGRGNLINEVEVRNFRGAILTYDFYDAESRRVDGLRSAHCR